MMISLQTAQTYYQKLHKTIPNDTTLSLAGVGEVLCKITDGCRLEEAFHTDLSFAATVALLRYMLEDEHLDRLALKNECRAVVLPDEDTAEDMCHFASYDLINTKINRKNFSKAYDLIQAREYEANQDFFQSFNTFESLIKRFCFMEKYRDTLDKSVIFIGDDELFSLFYALNGRAKRIAVVDIDDRILKYIRKISERYQLGIETYCVNILEEFPNCLENKFDIFFASGLKDYDGLIAFLLAGLVSLREDKDSTGYIAYYNYAGQSDDSFEKLPLNFKFQKYLTNINFYIQYCIPCDEMVIPRHTIDHIVRMLLEEEGTSLFEMFSKLAVNNVLSVDPAYPFVGVSPIQLARIKPAGNFYSMASRSQKLLQSIAKSTNT